jgi:hypothetical protein
MTIKYTTPTVGFVAGEHGSVDGENLKSVTANAAVMLQGISPVTAIAENGYYLNNWTTSIRDESGQYKQFATSALIDKANYEFEDQTLTANFTAIPVAYPGSYEYNGAGIGPNVMGVSLNNAAIESERYENSGGAAYSSASKPVNAGSYKLTAVIEREGEEIGRGEYEFVIAKRLLSYSVNPAAQGRQYDGTTEVAVSGAIGRYVQADYEAGEIGFSPVGTISGADAGNYTVQYALTGAKSGNYELPTRADSVVISRREISYEVAGKDKEYDGTTRAIEGVNFDLTFRNLVGGEEFNGNCYSITGVSTQYNVKNAGKTAIRVSLNLSAGGINGAAKTSNYLLLNTDVESGAVNIIQKNISAEAVAASREYDGTAVVAVSGSLSGVIASDEGKVSLAATGAIANKDVNTYEVELSLTGPEAGNYNISSAAPTVVISQRAITASITAAGGKVYDGTNKAEYETLTVSFNGTYETFVIENQFEITAEYADKNVGTWNITAEIELKDGNYSLAQNILTSSGKISQASIGLSQVAGVKFEKVYDGTTAVKEWDEASGSYVDLTIELLAAKYAKITGISEYDKVSDVAVFRANTPPAYLNANAGTRAVTVTIQLISSNYTSSAGAGARYSFEGVILQAETEALGDFAFDYGTAKPSREVLSGITANGIKESVAGSLIWPGALRDKEYFGYSDSGSYEVEFAPDDPNYKAAVHTVNLAVARLKLSFVQAQPVMKEYDGTTDSGFDWTVFFGGLVLGDKLSELAAVEKFEYASAGAGVSAPLSLKFTLGADGNYELSDGTLGFEETLEGTVTRKKLSVSVMNAVLQYDGEDKSGEVSWSYNGGTIEADEGVITAAGIIIEYIKYIDVYDNGRAVVVSGAELAKFEAVRAYEYRYALTVDYAAGGAAAANYYTDAEVLLKINRAPVAVAQSGAVEDGKLSVIREKGRLTVNNPNGYDAEYSIDGGATWQAEEVFEVSDYKTYDVQIRLKGTDAVDYEQPETVRSKYYTNIAVPIGEAAGGISLLGLLIFLITKLMKYKKAEGSVKAASGARVSGLYNAEKARALAKHRATTKVSDGGGGANKVTVSKQGAKQLGDTPDMKIISRSEPGLGRNVESQRVYKNKAPKNDATPYVSGLNKNLNPIKRIDSKK